MKARLATPVRSIASKLVPRLLVVLPMSSQTMLEPGLYVRFPAKVCSPGELPGVWVPDMVVAPSVPDPPRPDAELIVVRALVAMLPFTTSVPAETVVFPR